ncbi:MAG: hypothetical protein NTU74_01745 [Deltaproteobacteria bacterium]|nr:hypothetical protein [Deltaproteobacteria bacterium]
MTVSMILVAIAAGRGESGQKPDDKIVAVGDDFVLTQENVDAYSAFFASKKLKLPQNEIINSVLKYELLSREYRRNQERQALTEGSESVEPKIVESNKYIQKILSDWIISGAVIESYYRANPEKYRTGTAPDGRINVKPLDDALKDEIRFMIIESNKENIVKEFVDSLINKYHIKMN